MTSASLYMRELPSDAYVLFYSERASINLETRQFLAPDVHGEDRSAELLGATTMLQSHRGPIVYVLLGKYIERLPEIEAEHPGGVARSYERDGKTEFAAYELPPR